jgi:hypothetical protein
VAKRYVRNPGADQIAAWKRAASEHNRTRRRSRWKRQPAGYKPGMNIIQPPARDRRE